MRIRVGFLLLLLIMSPVTAWSGENCQQYADEMRDYMIQWQQVAAKYKDHVFSSKEEGERAAAEQRAVLEPANAAKNRLSECLGLSTPSGSEPESDDPNKKYQ